MNKHGPKQIRQTPIEEVKPYPANARVHTPEQIERLAEVITEVGWTKPIIVDVDMVVIAGHGALEAAHLLGRKRVPVIVADWMTPTQAAKARLADNALAELSEWSPELVVGELEDLGKADKSFNAKSLGFDTRTLKKLGAIKPASSSESAPGGPAMGDGRTVSVTLPDVDTALEIEAEMQERGFEAKRR